MCLTGSNVENSSYVPEIACRKRTHTDTTTEVGPSWLCSEEHDREGYAGRTISELISEEGGDVDKVKSAISDLVNEIHPIFDYEHFVDHSKQDDASRSDRGPQDFDPLDYEVLRPAVRLVSRILTHPDQIRFWYGLLHAKESKPGTKVFEWNAKKMLTAAETAETLEMLHKFSENVVFGFEEIGGSSGETSSKFWYPGQRQYDPSLPEWKNTARLRKENGKRVWCRSDKHFCSITVHKRLLDDMRAWRQSTIEELRFTYFEFSDILLHEACHAIAKFIHGEWSDHKDKTHNFIFDGGVDEEGYEFQNYIWGGIPLYRRDGLLFTIQDWPVYDIVMEYVEKGAIEEGNLHTPRFPSMQQNRTWCVPSDEITRLFQQASWDAWTKEGRPRFLHLRRCCEVTYGQDDIDEDVM